MEESVSSIVFILTAYLSIPDIEVRPAIDEVQSVLVQAGKIILSVSKGVATWKKSIKNTAKIKNAGGKNGKRYSLPHSTTTHEILDRCAFGDAKMSTALSL